ncbi:hypothetical protein OK016_00060 [Vibrio chagasii]|nr:hypothetical protein [Vibrio chagasii]
MTTVSLSADAPSPKARTSPTRRHWTKSCGWRGWTVTLSNGATITIADGATSGTTTVPASDDGYVGEAASATITRCNGRQLRELGRKTQQQQRRPSQQQRPVT